MPEYKTVILPTSLMFKPTTVIYHCKACGIKFAYNIEDDDPPTSCPHCPRNEEVPK